MQSHSFNNSNLFSSWEGMGEHTPVLIIDDRKATITRPKQSIDTIPFIKSNRTASENHGARETIW